MGENLWIFGIALTMGAIITLLGVVIGSWIMFRGKTTTNESFIGRQPRGEAFTIDTDGAEEFPGIEEPSKDEEHILKKTGDFLKTLTGGK